MNLLAKPVNRLTLAYLAILMAISLFFSAIIYQESSSALQEGFRRQVRALEPQFGQLPAQSLEQLRIEQLDEGRRRILLDLLGTNLFVLAVGGVGSYWLAQRTLQPIEEALTAQSRFTADASHELRTPLTAMRTEIEVALRDKSLKLNEAKALLTSNLEEIDKLRDLASGLLTLSRHQNGESVAFAQVDLETVAREAQERLGAIIASSKADVRLKASGNPAISGSREALVNLLVILLDNAIKYSPNKPKIEIALSQTAKNAVITITDNGIGIKASELPYIFQRFYRADSSRAKTTEGYGLGLSIARQITEMHHGSISAASTPDKGTTFTVTLPKQQPAKSLPL